MKQQHSNLTSHCITVNRNLEMSIVGGILGIQSRKRREKNQKSRHIPRLPWLLHVTVTSHLPHRRIFNIFVYQKPTHLYSSVIRQLFVSYSSVIRQVATLPSAHKGSASIQQSL